MTFEIDGPLVLVGAGKMGSALLSGWLTKGLTPDQVAVREPSAAPEITALEAQGLSLNAPVAEIADRKPALVLIAVKPQAMADVLPEWQPLVRPGTELLSIAAGTGLERPEKQLGTGVHAVRATPNTPAAVGRGMTVAGANRHVTSAQKALADQQRSAVGELGWVEDEALIDAVTAIS